MKIPDFYSRMTARERLMLFGVLGIVFLLLNLFVWSWLTSAIRQGREDVRKREAQRKEQTIFIKERELWIKRDEWLQVHQPVIKSPAEASTLLKQLQDAAAKQSVVIENPQIGTGETTPAHRTVFASFDMKSPWKPLMQFLYDVQSPEAFVVLESANLSVDSNDPTTMRAKFKVARWFAPAQRNRTQP